MKLLAFTAAYAADFSYAYIALHSDGVTLTAPERRTHGKLLDRLDAISVEKDGAGRILHPDGGEVVVEDVEYTLLLRMFEATPWRSAISRDVNRAEDFLRAAPEWHAPVPKPELVLADGGAGAE